MIDRQRPRDGILREIRVLVLIDQDEPVPLIERFPNLRVIAQKDCHMEQQVIEVNRIRSGQMRLIGRIDLLYENTERMPGPGRVALRSDQIALGPANLRRDPFRCHVSHIDAEPRDNLAKGAGTLLGVVNRVILLETYGEGISSEQPRTEAMKCTHPYGWVGSNPRDPPQFVGCLVGER